jgi:hypothetical protein
MKRAIFLIITALFVTLFAAKVPVVFAQETVIQTDTPVGIDPNASESSVVVPQRVNYELPYPGMLPDNPFYFLKMARDGIVKLLINDSIKRARFSLLNGEKRMYAGKMLVDKSKDQLAVSTISKSNNYMFEALDAIRAARKQNSKNLDIRPFLQQFQTATQKHQEMMADVESSIDTKWKKQFLVEKKRLQGIRASVDSLLLQK